MRELDTESPVVWPAWCYTGEVSGESTTAGGQQRGEAAELASTRHLLLQRHPDGTTGRGNLAAANTATAVALDAARGGGGASPQGAATGAAGAASSTPRQPRARRRHQNHNGIHDAPQQVKAERLTPDNNSTSSRSVTPSSSGHPSTPPNATSLSGPDGPASSGGAPPHHHHLKHMEMMNRNYSDFMRSLAAKYQSNPNDYFASATRNGYPAGLDPRFPGAFKASAATPFLMTGPQGPQMPTGGSAAAASTASASSAAAALSAKEPKEPKQSGGSSGDSATGSIFGGTPAANLFPPMLDMSSTQALLHMVRTANAAQQSAAELESYLKGANKRETSLSSPLDLSSPSGVAPRKRVRTSARPDSVSPKPSKLAVLSLTGTPTVSPTALHTPASQQQLPAAAAQTSGHSPSGPTPRPGSPPPIRCPSLCAHAPCADGQAVNRWTVDDVVSYVSSIDICAEYAQNFREHRIDGSSLPLLSEEHLTGPIGMKLGPALKLRVLLARKLGACTVCLHCAHCHQTPLPSAALSAAAAIAQAAAAAQQSPSPRRPSGPGNPN